jgi:prepilin-type N-terminal cleavage/methylation domain-containing protein
MHSSHKRAFTLIELLMVIVILMILAGMTLSVLRGFRSHQVLEQAAARVEMLVETARTAALVHGEPIYLGLAYEYYTPPEYAFRALVLFRNLETPDLLMDWQLLPAGIFFREDPLGIEKDLLKNESIVPEAPNKLFPPEISGPVLILLRINPDGRFQLGKNGKMESASLTLLSTEPTRLDTNGRPAAAEPLDAIRIDFRPLTGTTRVERLLP